MASWGVAVGEEAGWNGYVSMCSVWYSRKHPPQHKFTPHLLHPKCVSGVRPEGFLDGAVDAGTLSSLKF